MRSRVPGSSGGLPPVPFLRRSLPPHQLPVPPQQRLRAHDERGPGRTGEHPARRCEHHPVEPAEAGAILLTPQDLQLVTKDEDLDLLDRSSDPEPPARPKRRRTMR